MDEAAPLGLLERLDAVFSGDSAGTAEGSDYVILTDHPMD
jgi:hypothetical protein